jgi:hypothetical protein
VAEIPSSGLRELEFWPAKETAGKPFAKLSGKAAFDKIAARFYFTIQALTRRPRVSLVMSGGFNQKDWQFEFQFS